MKNIPFWGEWELFPQQLQFFVTVIDLERCFSCQQPYFSTVVDSLVCVGGVPA